MGHPADVGRLASDLLTTHIEQINVARLRFATTLALCTRTIPLCDFASIHVPCGVLATLHPHLRRIILANSPIPGRDLVLCINALASLGFEVHSLSCKLGTCTPRRKHGLFGRRRKQRRKTLIIRVGQSCF